MKSALVLGAGIAGLTAAYELQRAGWQVTVLEREARVGGRMSSDKIAGFVMDRGAQFLSSEYSVIRSLLVRTGLESDLQATEPYLAVVRAGRLRCLRVDRPLDAALSGLLSWRALGRLARMSWRWRTPLMERSLSDYSTWADCDDENARTWVERELGQEVHDYLTEPTLQGLYFQSPAQNSRALALMVHGFAVRRARTLSLTGGLGRLPEALAQELTVHTQCPVEHLDWNEDGVRVRAGGREWRADYAVLAVPAPAAQKLYAGQNEDERALLATPYSAALNIALRLDAGFVLPRALQKVYGVLLPASERHGLAAIAIEGNKCSDRAREGHLLHLMPTGEMAAHWLLLDDGAVLAATLPELERYLPGVATHLIGHSLYRWPWAEPFSPVGRAARLQRYRAMPPGPILLAGDYMAAPYTEGAAEAGHWTAQRLLAG